MWGCPGGAFRGGHALWFLPHGLMMILVLVGIYLLFRHLSRTVSSGTKSGLNILEERYARGEITKEEYLERKEAILKSR